MKRITILLLFSLFALLKGTDSTKIAFKYSKDNNLNGSIDSIAGILNKDRNVLGMMPHPERACEKVLGSNDGINIFKSMIG